MRSKPNYNYPAFMKAAKKLREDGWIVHNPAEMDIAADGVDYGAQGLSLDEQAAHAGSPPVARKYAKRDIDCILSLKGEYGDTLFLLPDWKDSTGAMAEAAVARWVGVEVVELGEGYV
jgi:hypothetical protein